ncbi:hypothetical protein LCGC14_1854280 [marine sediment metagenome]|uniref:Uncharacterized protein n=1 Tax=marine sediment metagenome TaxID=412755 RepID=A0A0F9GXP7_9ZZZZ
MDSDAERMAFYGGLASKSTDPVDELKALLMPIPGTREAVYERLAFLPFMEIKAAGVLWDKITYKGESFFELTKNLFYDGPTYLGWPLKPNQYLGIATLHKGFASAELDFERQNTADKIEKFWKSFFRKARIIRDLARNSYGRDIRRLRLRQFSRDMAMYRGANTLCEEAKGWKMFSS